MAPRPTWLTYFGVISLLTTVAAGFALFITISADLLHIGGVKFGPLFVVIALLYVPAGTRRMAEAVAAGAESRSRLLNLRHEYVVAVLEHPELRAWPEKTIACLMAASAILVRAAMRSWVILIVAILFFRAIGAAMDSDVRPLWIILTVLESFSIGSRAYRRGTLPLAGMSAGEMEEYFRSRLASVAQASSL